MQRTRRTRRVMLLLGVVAVGAVVYLVEERVRGTLALRAWERQMASRGETLSLDALIPAAPTNREVQRFIEAGRRAIAQRQWCGEGAAEVATAPEPTRPPESDRDLNAYNRSRYWLALSSLPALSRAMDKAAQADAASELVVAAIALKRYRLRHGRLPAQLESLVPEFVQTVPRDWYAGAPLRYRPEGQDRFVLYSVGEDGVDDGGDSCDEAGKPRPFLGGRDLVWPQPATAEEADNAETGRPPGGLNR